MIHFDRIQLKYNILIHHSLLACYIRLLNKIDQFQYIFIYILQYICYIYKHLLHFKNIIINHFNLISLSMRDFYQLSVPMLL